MNSHDTNSNAASGSNTSQTRKIKDIFLQPLKDVLKRTSAGSNSSSVSPSEQTIQNPGIFTPHGIWGLKLTPDDITALINSPILSNGERIALKTYTQTSGTANNMNNNIPLTDAVTYATIKSEETPPKEHYFYAYQQNEGGLWFSTMVVPSVERAKHSLTYLTVPIHRKKLCCVML